MNNNYSFFKVSDGQSLAYKVWDEVDSPKGTVIIVHGMAEHIERYEGIATYLNSQGLIVYGIDQRGHGKTPGRKGFFTSKNGWSRVIKDQVEFYNYVKNNNPKIKISYIGHSMGSYITRAMLSMEKLEVERLILSGTGFESGFTTKTVRLLAGIIGRFKGITADAVLLDKMTNNPFADSIKDPLTKFDWLSRDNDVVSKYINDSNCGFVCTNQFFKDFLKIVTIACNKSEIKKMNKTLPILLYSGENDPVGGKNLSGVKKIKKIYDKLGFNATLEINPGGRHESLNETNKDEVFKYFAEFLLGMKQN